MIYVQFSYRCTCYNYNYYHSIKRAGRFVGVAYIIILLVIYNNLCAIFLSMYLLLGLWLRLECSLDSLSIVSTDHQIDRGLSASLRLYEMCHVLVIV